MTQAAAPPLGELNIPPPLDALYLLGDTVALFNSLGIRLLPGFSPDLLLNRRLGLWVLSGGHRVDLQGFTPEKAADQFAEFTGEPLRAVLGGYARRAYQLLEPRHPGFTQDLLTQLLPAPVPNVPAPRPQLVDFEAVFRAYGCSLQADGQHSRLTFGPPVAPVPRPPDWQLVVASVTVFVAELNLTPWLLHVEACDPAHEMTQLLGALARHQTRKPEWDGLLPRLLGTHQRGGKLFAQISRQPAPVANLLCLIAGIYGHPENPEDIYEELPVFKTLRFALEKLPPDSSALYEFTFAGIMDGLEWLAREADAQGDTRGSLLYAQRTQIALQMLLEQVAPPLTESWFSRVEAQENGYSWLGLSPDHRLDHWTVWYFANYAGSAALAVKQHSAQISALLKQGAITNQLWTACWRVLNQLRKALRLCYALSQQQPPTAATEGMPGLAFTLQHLLAHYQQILKEVAAMTERSSGWEHGVSHWAPLMVSLKENEPEEPPLMQELLECMVVHGTLGSHGYGPEAIQSLGKLIALMP